MEPRSLFALAAASPAKRGDGPGAGCSHPRDDRAMHWYDARPHGRRAPVLVRRVVCGACGAVIEGDYGATQRGVEVAHRHLRALVPGFSSKVLPRFREAQPFAAAPANDTRGAA